MVHKKKEDLGNQLNQEQTSTQHPNIDGNSRKIIEEKMKDRKDKPTYERLYGLNKDH
jgi:hypothetical protein